MRLWALACAEQLPRETAIGKSREDPSSSTRPKRAFIVFYGCEDGSAVIRMWKSRVVSKFTRDFAALILVAASFLSDNVTRDHRFWEEKMLR